MYEMGRGAERSVACSKQKQELQYLDPSLLHGHGMCAVGGKINSK